jgi:hypothetical protein
MVLLETLSQTVKPLGDGLMGRAGQRFRAGVDLDAGKDAPGRQSLCERRAAGTLLMDRFVIHDDAANELGGARAGKEHLPVGAPALLRRLDPQCVEAFRQGGDGFVSRQDPLALGNER